MIRRRKRIAARSQRAFDKLPIRARVVDQAWDRDRGRCRAEHLVPEIRCGGPIDVHELVPRSVWPDGELEVDNVVLICRNHHRWVDANPARAHDVDLHRFSWERPGVDRSPR